MRSVFTLSQRERLGSFQLRRTKRGLELPRVPSRALVVARKALGAIADWIRKALKPRPAVAFKDAPREPNWTQALLGAGFVLAVILWALGAR